MIDLDAEATGHKRFSPALRMVLSAGVIVTAGRLGTSGAFYDTCVQNAFLAFSLAGFVLICLRVRPQWREALALAVATGALTVADLLLLHYPFSVYGILGLAGLASIALIALRGIASAGEARWRLGLAFLFAVLSVSSNALAGFFHNWTARLTPTVLDLYLYCFDASLRVQFAFLAGQAFARWAWLSYPGMLVYLAFPIPVALVFAGQLVRDRKAAICAMTAFLITGPAGVVFYALCPALGPIYLFTNRFPWGPLTSDQASRLILETPALAGLRNSLPSLHLAWVLLAWWYSKGLSAWERGVVLFFLVFTVISTLGTGEHYLIDLIVAWPFALFVYALCAWPVPWSNGIRGISVFIGLGMTLGWIGALRMGVKMFWISPALPWLACAVTVVWATLLRHRLASAGQRDGAAQSISAIASAPAAS